MSDLLNMFSNLVLNNNDQMHALLGGQDDKKSLMSAAAAAVPALMEALNQKSNSPEGAETLSRALDDHDGSKLGDLNSLLGDFKQNSGGEEMSKQILGADHAAIVNDISQKSGLAPESSANLLSMLAPVLMQALGQEKRTQGLDAGGVSNLTTQLSGLFNSPNSGLMQLAGGLLDKNKDGHILDDVVNLAKGFFK